MCRSRTLTTSSAIEALGNSSNTAGAAAAAADTEGDGEGDRMDGVDADGVDPDNPLSDFTDRSPRTDSETDDVTAGL